MVSAATTSLVMMAMTIATTPSPRTHMRLADERQDIGPGHDGAEADQGARRTIEDAGDAGRGAAPAGDGGALGGEDALPDILADQQAQGVNDKVGNDRLDADSVNLEEAGVDAGTDALKAVFLGIGSTTALGQLLPNRQHLSPNSMCDPGNRQDALRAVGRSGLRAMPSR